MKTLIFIFLIFLSSNLFAQWSTVDGLCGGQINDVKKCGNYLFAASDGAGIFRTSDSGLNWEECNNGITNLQTKSIGTDLNNIYCGTYGGGVFKSADYGNNWISVNGGFLPSFVTKVVFLNGTLTAITLNGIYQLVNNQWEDMQFISSYASNILAYGNKIFALSSQYMYRTTNNGLNWIQISYPTNTNSYTSMTVKDNYLYTVCNLGVYRMHTDSLVLRYYDLSLSGSFPSYIYSDSNNIFVCAKSKVYRAENGGPLTSIFTLSAYEGFVPLSIFSDNNNLFIAVDKGVLHTSLSQINWSYRNKGIRNLTLQYLSFSQNEIFAVSNNLAVYRGYPSDNQWSTFYYEQSPYYNTAIYSFERKNSSTLYMGKDYGQSFLRSTNNGIIWGQPTSFFGQAEIDCISFVGSNIILAGWGVHIFNEADPFSTQDFGVGSNIHSIYNYGAGFLACSDSNGILRFKPDTIYPDEFVYDTLNNGLSSHRTYDITLLGNNLYAAAVDGIYKTNKDNINWVRVFSTIDNSAFFKILNINNILVIASPRKIFTSLDNGNSWNLLYTAPDKKFIKALKNNSEYLYVSISNYGLIKRAVANLIGVNAINNIMPENFLLHQNYPNPFNPSTNIQYDLPKDNFVTIKVYDLLGKQVAKLINEFKPAGSYLISFDGSKLSSGIYFYKIETKDFIQTKRMVLVK